MTLTNDLLRQIGQIGSTLNELRDDVRALKKAVPRLEAREADIGLGLSGINSRLDDLGRRFDRIERRLKLTEKKTDAR